MPHRQLIAILFCTLLTACSDTNTTGFSQGDTLGTDTESTGGEPVDISTEADTSAEDTLVPVTDSEEVTDVEAAPDVLANPDASMVTDTNAPDSDETPADIAVVEDSTAPTSPDGQLEDSQSVDDTETPPDSTELEDVIEPGADGESAAGDVSMDVATEDSGGPPPLLDTCPGTVVITSPGAESFFVLGAPFIAEALVTGLDATAGPVMVRWETPYGVVMGETPVLPDGTSSGNLDTAQMPLGVVPMQARLVTDAGACAETTEIELVFCQYVVSDDFDAALDVEAWNVFGSSYWDQGGWLEMTGTAQGQRGAVYNTEANVAAGSVSIAFSMATGGGSGADGFAMTILQTNSIDELENVVIANALPGSGIGYGVGGAYGSWEGNALTVEIDTYHNVFNGTNELHTDPTPNDHIALTLDGDAGNHLWWTEVGEIEDLAWRDIRVDIIGAHVRVWIDGALTLDADYPELDFRGGYIFFSGSTGYYTNYHRFDNLDIIHTCQP